MKQRILICGLFGLLMWPQVGLAGGDGQTNPDLPFSRDLGIEAPQLFGLSDNSLKKLVPLKPIEVADPPAEERAPPEEGFVLKSIEIEGATLYMPSELRKIYRFFLDKYMAFDDLGKITNRLERFYANDGWLTTRAIVPAQRIADGRLKIKIFEGYLDAIVVEGNAGNAKGIIKTYLADLRTGKPARVADVEKSLARLGDFQNFRIQQKLRAAESGKEGGVDLVIDVIDRDIVSGSVSLNNASSDSVGPWILSLSGQFESLVRGGDRLSFSMSNSFFNPDETLIGRMSYEMRIPHIRFNFSYDGLSVENSAANFNKDIFGTIIGVYVSSNLTRPDPELSNTPTKDLGLRAGTYVSIPFYRSTTFNFGNRVEYDFEQRLTRRIDDSSVQTQGDTHILSLGFNLNYRSLWGNFTTFEAKVRQGLTEGGGLDSGTDRMPDSGSSVRGDQFTRRGTWLTADLSYNQNLLSPRELLALQIPNLSLFISATAQYAFKPLTNSQNISFGNSSIGRGFSSGRISGDHGWGTSTELRATWRGIGQVNLGELGPRNIFDELTFYGFFDQGQISNVIRANVLRGFSPVSGSFFPTLNLFSAGLGVRARFFGLFYIDATWARALNNPYDMPTQLGFGIPTVVNGQIVGVDPTDKGHDEFLFRLAYFL